MDRDWVRLGRALAAGRKQAGLTQPDVASRLGASLSTVQAIERGGDWTKPTPTIRAYARLLGWTDGSVETVATGGEPTLEADAGARAEPSAPVPDGLPLRVAEELAAGPLLDTMVIRLPGGGQAVVVARGKEGGSPEEIQAALEAWRRAQPQLQEIEVRAETDEPPESAA
ncbi:helix-turn-helix transcriptional regulator [Streptomyces sp. NPDC005989]|uniref:helix-turn-helix domain-containing protein n=1 Tax=Streptomyces sp. NPDC005989 TaxID=3156727 RepID=UPI003408431B